MEVSHAMVRMDIFFSGFIVSQFFSHYLFLIGGSKVSMKSPMNGGVAGGIRWNDFEMIKLDISNPISGILQD